MVLNEGYLQQVFVIAADAVSLWTCGFNLGNQHSVTMLQCPMVMKLVFATFVAGFQEAKSLGKPAVGHQW